MAFMLSDRGSVLKTEKSKKVNTSLRLDRATLKALKQQAVADDTSVQKIVERLIDGYLRKADRKNK